MPATIIMTSKALHVQTLWQQYPEKELFKGETCGAALQAPGQPQLQPSQDHQITTSDESRRKPDETATTVPEITLLGLASPRRYA